MPAAIRGIVFPGKQPALAHDIPLVCGIAGIGLASLNGKRRPALRNAANSADAVQ
ncbi:hypothetical protein ACTJLC_19270 [Paraburkholderia sp. 22099]|jgi:hypothetical protein|uniref:hypothetical protein n=1 Tax=Paraburkholderia TaxID=1822464 RepID=UPI0013563D19|nr:MULTISPECIES: hypothetical protein [Paraburkholderia]